MRFVKYLFMALVGIGLIVVALANRGVTTVNILPGDFAQFLPIPNSYSMPLFLVILAGVLAGLLIGFFWEYLREHKHRANAAHHKREKTRLEREVKGLRDKTGEGKDDVLALLD